MRRTLAALLVMVSLASRGAAAPPQVSVSATASKTEVGVGEIFTVELRAQGPEGTQWTFPPDLATEEIELHTTASGEAQNMPPPPGVGRYDAMVLAVDEAQVPAIPVKFRLPDGTEGESRTAPLTLKVVSLLPKDPKEQKLADIRGPVGVAAGRAFWIALATASLLLAATVLAWWLKRRRTIPGGKPVAADVPPDVEAREALRTLAASSLLSQGAYRAFYIQLTEIAKRYLERRLAAPVLEMTSTEAVACLRDHPKARSLVGTLRDLVDVADRVKFARGEGMVAEAESHLKNVGAMVERLEAQTRPATETPKEKVA